MTKNPTIRAHKSQPQQSPSIISKHQALFLNAIKCLLRNPVRSGVVILSLVALLTPFVTGIAICEGIKSQYRSALEQGGDLYVARDNYGSNAPIELDIMEQIQSIQGVTHVVPRVIGRTYVKGKFLAVLGTAPKYFPSSIEIIKGRKPRMKGEVLLGQEVAKFASLDVGSRFSMKRKPVQVFKIVGLFTSPCNIWNTDLLLMDFEDASYLFGLEDKATDISVMTRPGYEEIVDIIVRLSEENEKSAQPALRVQTRELIDRYSQRGFNIKAGVYAGFYCLVFALGIPSIGVISGFGLSERRREIGVMKALGWQTQEVLEMVALENLILSILSVPFTILVTAGWIYLFNGAGISKFFIASLDVMIPFSVPSRIFPIPVFLGALLAIVLTMVGSIYSTWRTSIVPPSEAMKL
ncbi:MAG: FtsX-like permease family protein [Desulfobacteraceae bacterium]|jgi:ABC-type lipoprotein release transport system permease subunit